MGHETRDKTPSRRDTPPPASNSGLANLLVLGLRFLFVSFLLLLFGCFLLLLFFTLLFHIILLALQAVQDATRSGSALLLLLLVFLGVRSRTTRTAGWLDYVMLGTVLWLGLVRAGLGRTDSTDRWQVWLVYYQISS